MSDIIKLHDLRPEKGANKAKRRVGRGEGGLVRKNQPVKVLGNGEISVKINVTAQKFSKSAVEKIEAAGGTTNKA